MSTEAGESIQMPEYVGVAPGNHSGDLGFIFRVTGTIWFSEGSNFQKGVT